MLVGTAEFLDPRHFGAMQSALPDELTSSYHSDLMSSLGMQQSSVGDGSFSRRASGDERSMPMPGELTSPVKLITQDELNKKLEAVGSVSILKQPSQPAQPPPEQSEEGRAFLLAYLMGQGEEERISDRTQEVLGTAQSVFESERNSRPPSTRVSLQQDEQQSSRNRSRVVSFTDEANSNSKAPASSANNNKKSKSSLCVVQ